MSARDLTVLLFRFRCLILLGSFFISACHKEDPCTAFRNSSTGSNWGEILKKAPACLSPSEIETLTGSAAKGIMLLHVGEGLTVQQVLTEAEQVEKDAASNKFPNLQAGPPPRPPQNFERFLTENVRQAVVYIFKADGQGGISHQVKDAFGTGFLVTVPSKKDSTRSLWVLFTARHIVDPQWAAPTIGDDAVPSLVYIRMNRKAAQNGQPAGVVFGRVVLREGGKKLFIVPTDDSVDAAAIVLPPNSIPLGEASVLSIPVSIFATDDELKALKLDDKVLTAGLIPGATTESVNQPITQEEPIKQISDQLFDAFYRETDPAKELHVWMISPRLAPGFSGAPMLTVTSRTLGTESKRGPVLIGIQSMSLDQDSNLSGITPLPYFTSILDELSRSIPEADVTRGFAAWNAYHNSGK